MLPYVSKALAKEVKIGRSEDSIHGAGVNKDKRYCQYWLEVDGNKVSPTEFLLLPETDDGSAYEEQTEEIREFCRVVGAFVYGMVYEAKATECVG